VRIFKTGTVIQTSFRLIVPMRMLTGPNRLLSLETNASILLCWLYSLRNESISRRTCPGKHKTTIATARKILHIIYWMLMRKEQFHSQGFNPGDQTCTV